MRAGATSCHAVASHLVLPPGALGKLRASGMFEHILGTDSHPGSQKLPPDAIESTAPLFVSAIERTYRI